MQSLLKSLGALLLIAFSTSHATPICRNGDGCASSWYKTNKSTLRPETYEFIEKISKSMELPGFTAVIASPKGDEIWSYGKRDGTGTPVDSQTYWGMASNSKLITGVTVATVAEHGHSLKNGQMFSLDSRMKDIDPTFKMTNQTATDKATVWDFLSMYTGIPGHNLALEPNDTNQAAFDRLAELKANLGFRQLWQYSNIGYVIGGYIVDKVTGRNFYEVADKIVFKALGLDGTSDARKARRSGRLSQGFMRQDINSTQCAIDLAAHNHTLTQPPAKISNARAKNFTAYPPTLFTKFPDSCVGRQESMEYWTKGTGREWGGGGSFIMSAESLLKWVKEVLAPKTISQSVINIANSGHVNASNKAITDARMPKYGLGTISVPYRGFETHQHDGALPGTNSQFVRVYNESTGVFVAVNEDLYGTQVKYAIADTILDDLLNLPPMDHFTEQLSPLLGISTSNASPDGSTATPKRAIRRQQALSSQNVSTVGYVGKTFSAPGYLPFTLQSFDITDPAGAEDKFSFPVDFLVTDLATQLDLSLTGPVLIAKLRQSFASHMVFTHFDGPYWNATAALIWERSQNDASHKRSGSADGHVSKYIGKLTGVGPSVFTEDGIGMFGDILSINVVEAPIPVPTTENVEENAALFWRRVQTSENQNRHSTCHT